MAADDSSNQPVDQKGTSMGQEYILQAQSPVTKKSIYQKLFEYFGSTKYIHPDLHVVIGGESLGVVTYTGSESKSDIKISLPENTLLQHFTQTQNKTELQAIIGNLTTVASNKVKRGSIPKPDLQSTNKSCQTNTDNMCNILFEILKMQQRPDCNNTEDKYSSIKGHFEQEGPFYRGLGIKMKSESRKNFVFDGHQSLLQTITYTTDSRFQEKDTCILFSWKSNLYSPSTVRKIIKENDYQGENCHIILISEKERQLRIEVLLDVVIATASKIAESLQNLKDGRLVRKFKEVLHPLESTAEDIRITDSDNHSSTQQKRKTRKKNDRRTNVKNKPEQQRTKSTKNGNINEQHYLSNISKLEELYKIEQEKLIMKNQSENDLSLITDNYCEKPDFEKTKTKLPSHRVVPTKMKNSKVKTQSKLLEWKIYLQPGEDELRNLVSDYFGDDMIRQAVYGMLESDVDRRFKASFERPNVPWPSMHPLLPYKLRFLDEDEDHNHTLSDPFTGDLYNQQKDDNSTVTEQVDSCEQSDCSSVEIDDGNHLNITARDENDYDCDQSN